MKEAISMQGGATIEYENAYYHKTMSNINIAHICILFLRWIFGSPAKYNGFYSPKLNRIGIIIPSNYKVVSHMFQQYS
jgi:hypothetical protein